MNKGSSDDRLPIETILDEYTRKGAKSYALLDSGEGRKLEEVGGHLIERQCAVAFWKKRNPKSWKHVAATHQRTEQGGGFWESHSAIEPYWFTKLGRIVLKTKLTSFGHLGFFVEQVSQWAWLSEKINEKVKNLSPDQEFKVLNLFAYTGGSSIACALAGAQVTHVDAARGVVDWAKQNAAINRVPEGSIRFAVEDCKLFLEREAKRGNKYDAVIMDPPSFGRGPNKEVFKIEDDITTLLQCVKNVMKSNVTLFHFSSHSQGFSPEVLKNLTGDILELGQFSCEGGEMLMPTEKTDRLVPSGQFFRILRK
ncbi:MAG: class I SAM-dependent methyltransferase [Bdellovibrionota bacterium]